MDILNSEDIITTEPSVSLGSRVLYYIINIAAIVLVAYLIRVIGKKKEPQKRKSEVIIIENENYKENKKKPPLRPKTGLLNKKPSLKPVKLRWSDFWGPINEESPHKAYTYWYIRYSYSSIIKEGKVIVDLTIECHFDKKRAWVKPDYQTDELLNHEQGHYNIGCICAMEFKKRLKEAVLTPEKHKEEIKALFDSTLKEFLEFEKRYDKETEHFRNKEKQREWDALIQQKIEDLKEFWES